MAWSARDIPNQTGRVAVVTGGNGGLGLEIMRELARKGARVVMTARNPEKAARAHAAVTAELPGAAIEVRALDLGSLASVRAFADEVLRRTPRSTCCSPTPASWRRRRARPSTASRRSSAPTTWATSSSRACCCPPCTAPAPGAW